MSPLQAYLREAASRPFAWGSSDCCFFATEWIVSLTGRDPAARYRGRYRSERGALRHIARAGGLRPLIETCMTEIGLAPTDDPRPGDVGIIDTLSGPTFAIRAEGGWVAKAPAGLAVCRVPHLVAWTVD